MMYGLLKKTKASKSEEERRAEALPLTKKARFDPVPLDRVEAQLVSPKVRNKASTQTASCL